MVKTCCVKGCKNEAYPGCGISFFGFPKEPQLLSKWLEACDRTAAPKTLNICSIHFKEEDFSGYIGCQEVQTPFVAAKRLKPTAVPYYLLPKTMIRPPGSGIAVPSVCVSIKGEHYLQIPPLLSSIDRYGIIKYLRNTRYHGILKLRQFYREQAACNSCKISKNLLLQYMVEDTSDSELDPLNTDTKPTTSGVVISLAPLNNPTETADHDYYKALSPGIKNEPEDEQMDEETPSNMADPDSEYMPSSNPVPAPSFKPSSKQLANRSTLQNEEIRKLKGMSEKQKRYMELLRKRIKCLQQKVKRTKNNNDRMKKVIAAVKRYTNRSEIDNILKGRFKELCDTVQSEKSLQETTAEKTQHTKGFSIDVIKFAISLFYISPKAYELVRRYMDLPQTKMLKKHIEKDTFTVMNMDT